MIAATTSPVGWLLLAIGLVGLFALALLFAPSD